MRHKYEVDNSILEHIYLLHLISIHQNLDCLEMVLGGCQITETTAVSVPERSWVNDLEDFLVSKALEGKSPETITRYRYELQRLLSSHFLV